MADDDKKQDDDFPDTMGRVDEEFPDDVWFGVPFMTEREVGDFTRISWDEIQALLQTENPTVRNALTDLIEEIERSQLDFEQIATGFFYRPIIGRTAINPETGLPHIVDQYVGFEDSAESMRKAKADLEAKGVDAPSGGGGGGGSYYISEITSDQWQRIRNKEIDEEQAEWENDPDNYDEDGEMYDYFDYDARDE
jgi:hypothetical protein|tara:strand:+ start:48 stop:632 length:585 start_codon:yes stop_codon:yes gene_type:complete